MPIDVDNPILEVFLLPKVAPHNQAVNIGFGDEVDLYCFIDGLWMRYPVFYGVPTMPLNGIFRF